MKNTSYVVSPESIKVRLKKEADTHKKDFNFLLLHYFIERLLFRLSISPYAHNFILKGGLLLYAVFDNKGRATRDIDFLAEDVKNNPTELVRIFSEIASIPVDDAVLFDTDKITTERIKEDADYEGIRIKLIAYLDRSRHVLQFDIGFDDVIVPHSVDMIYPTLLDMEAPKLKVYSLESVISEKFQAIIYLADLNSRMKDFYDIYELSRGFNFDGNSLYEAIAQTFKHRKTEFIQHPVVFTDDFPLLKDKNVQWQAFRRRTGIINISSDFSVIVDGIKKFLQPVYNALLADKTFTSKWDKVALSWGEE